MPHRDGSPTDREMVAWYEANQRDAVACSFCGIIRSSAYVQPQHPFWNAGRTDVFSCTDCLAKRNAESRARRKEQLAAMPRCSAPDCNRRGSWTVGEARVLVCGPHAKVVRSKAAQAGGGFAWLAPSFSRETILGWLDANRIPKETVNA